MDTPRRLDAALLSVTAGTAGPGPLFAGGPETRLGADLMLHADPAAEIGGQWDSPAGRLLTIRAENRRPGAWFALHVPLPGAADLSAFAWLILALRSSADHALIIRACLRSGTDAGFRDDFFPLDVLALPNEADHLDHLVPAHLPDLPPRAPWREWCCSCHRRNPSPWFCTGWRSSAYDPRENAERSVQRLFRPDARAPRPCDGRPALVIPVKDDAEAWPRPWPRPKGSPSLPRSWWWMSDPPCRWPAPWG